jgi:hypothetical protein
MKIIKRFITLICLLTALTSVAQAQGWRGFVPLHSTRAEVERLIGPPMKPNGVTYDLPDERVTVLYSDSSCVKGWPYGWNVSPGTAIGIIVYPKTKKMITDLGIDLGKYKKALNVRGDMIVYDNEAEGIGIGTDLNGEVIVVQYNPASKDKHLMCPEAAGRQAKIDKGESIYLKPFASYFDVSREEKGHLDGLVYKLNESPADSKVYIIGYGGAAGLPGRGFNPSESGEELSGQKVQDRCQAYKDN